MDKTKLAKLELEFAEARKEIVHLRIENRKLEDALSVFSKPMVVSDDESEDEGRKIRVIALPQGEAQERIDGLMREIANLSAEIVDLRSADAPSGAAMYEKNKELVDKVKRLEKNAQEFDASLAAALKTMTTKNDKENRRLKQDINELKAQLADAKSEQLLDRDTFDTRAREAELLLTQARAELNARKSQMLQLHLLCKKILANGQDFPGILGFVDAETENEFMKINKL